MKERPMLMSSAMVRAIFSGEKTQTRRLVKPQPEANSFGSFSWPATAARSMVETRDMGSLSPYGVRGDRLWIRETWGVRVDDPDSTNEARAIEDARQEMPWASICYGTDRAFDTPSYHWRPSIFMPRWASRLTLGITAVRVERLKEISDEDIRAEGVTRSAVIELLRETRGERPVENLPLRKLWQIGWDVINGERARFASNPFVWVVEFKKENCRVA